MSIHLEELYRARDVFRENKIMVVKMDSGEFHLIKKFISKDSPYLDSVETTSGVTANMQYIAKIIPCQSVREAQQYLLSK